MMMMMMMMMMMIIMIIIIIIIIIISGIISSYCHRSKLVKHKAWPKPKKSHSYDSDST